MSSFAEHIEVGIYNARTADGQRAEIQTILEQLDLAIRSATFGNGKLHVGKFRNPEDEEIMTFTDTKQRLVIQSTADERVGRIIAGWDTGTEGEYPAHLVYDYQSLYCCDGDELKQELSNLLETARVGRAIRHFSGQL